MDKILYEKMLGITFSKQAAYVYSPPDDDPSWFVPHQNLDRSKLGANADSYFPRNYVVTTGDNRWKIGKKFGVSPYSLSDIKRKDPRFYRPGDVVQVPPSMRVLTPAGRQSKMNRRNWQLGLANRGYDDRFLDALRHVESSGNNWAIGDKGKAVGPYQQWATHVDEANRILGLYNKKYGMNTPMFKYEDRTDEPKSRQMTRIILNYYGDKYANQNKGKQMSLEQFARIHNGGPDGYLKDSTKGYWTKVNNYINRPPVKR